MVALLYFVRRVYLLMCELLTQLFSMPFIYSEGEGQKTRNRIMQKLRHREELKKQAIAKGEPTEQWDDRIVLVGKKIKKTAAAEGEEQGAAN